MSKPFVVLIASKYSNYKITFKWKILHKQLTQNFSASKDVVLITSNLASYSRHELITLWQY